MDRLFEALRATLPRPEQVGQEFADLPERFGIGDTYQALLNRARLMTPGGPEMSLGQAVQEYASRIGGREIGQPIVGGLMAARDWAARRPGVAAQVGGSPLLALAVGGANVESDLPELTRAALAGYGREQARRAPLGEFGFETVADPTSYLPVGGAGRLAGRAGAALAARGGALPRAAGSLLTGAGRLGAGYEAAGALVPELFRQGGAAAKRVPGVGKLLEPSKGAILAREIADVGQAVQAVMRSMPDEKGRMATWREVATPREFDLPGGRANWPTLGRGWTTVEQMVSDSEGGYRQLAGLRILDDAAGKKNLIEAESARRIDDAKRATGLPTGDPERLTDEEYGAIKAATYDWHAKQVRALQLGAMDAIEELGKQAAPDLGSTADARIAQQVEDSIATLRAEVFSKRDMAAMLREGKLGMFDPTDPKSFLTGAAAEDTLYRQARANVQITLQQAIGQIETDIPGGVDAAARAMIEAAMEVYRGRVGELETLSRPWLERAGAVAPDLRATLTREAGNIDAATRTIQRAANRVEGLATPLLVADIQRAKPAAGVAEIEGELALLLEDAPTLLARLDDMVTAGTADRQTVGKIRALVEKYAPVGDLLKSKDWFNLSMHEWGKAQARVHNIAVPPPWLAGYYTAMGVWRDTALLSPRYHLANLAWMLFAGHKSDVSPSAVFNQLNKNMAQIANEMTGGAGVTRAGVRNVWESALAERNYNPTIVADSVPGFKAWGRVDRENNAVLPYAIEQQVRSLGQVEGGAGSRGLGAGGIDRSAVSRIPGGRATWTVAGAGLSGGVAATGDYDTEEERNRAIAQAALIGGAGGAALPTVVWASRMLGRAIEHAGRTAATVQGTEAAMKGAERVLIDFIRATPGREFAGVGRPLTRAGKEVETLADLIGYAPPAAVPGAGPPIPTPTVTTTLDIDMAAPAERFGTEATPEQLDAIERWVVSKGNRFSPMDLRNQAIREGVAPQTAQTWADQWDAIISEAESAGVGLNNFINYDYSDVSTLTESLRNTGMFPFITWAVKSAPVVATWLAQDPRLYIALDRLNNLSDDDLAESGLSPKFARLGQMGVLGDWVAEHLLGRADATVMGSPWTLFFPYADIGRPSRAPEDANIVEKALDAAGQFGVSPGPLPQLLGRATGVTQDSAGNLLRASSYAEMLTGGLTGRAINPELPIQMGVRGVRGAITGERVKTLTGSPAKDYYVRQRIAEMALADTGKPIGDPSNALYRRALDDPRSGIWRDALERVDRQAAAQTAIGSTVPFRTRTVTETETAQAAARKRQGLTTPDLAVTTAAAGAAAVEQARARGVTERGELAQIRDDAAKAARSAAWTRGLRAEPMAGALLGLGGKDEEIAKRQYGDFLAFEKKVRRMDPRRRAAKMKEYLGPRPELAAYLARIRTY